VVKTQRSDTEAAVDLAKSKLDSQTLLARYKYSLIKSHNLVKPVSISAKWITACDGLNHAAGDQTKKVVKK
jgi:hypothetical protein